MENYGGLATQYTRALLNVCFSQTCAHFKRQVLPFSWRIETAVTIENAYSLLDLSYIHVGLMWLDLDQGHTLEWYADFLELADKKRRIPWIAVVDSKALEQTQIRQFIAGLFYDYHTLPVEMNQLLWTLGHAVGMANLFRNSQPAAESNTGSSSIIGTSSQIQSVFRQLNKLAAVDAPLLITGESGTGKEMIVREIHRLSERANNPLIAINCAAMPSTLIQAELFGSERGAFTGAQQRKIGYIEAAHGGTLFLDEIGDLPLDMQGNLLRFLQEGTIQRLGSSAEIRVDVRVIAATNISLENAIENGTFREDLYYRLNVFHSHIPPLRERHEDIPLLANHFLKKYATGEQRIVRDFSLSAYRALQNHIWHGNVRELNNRVYQAVVMAEHALITPEDLGLPSSNRITSGIALQDVRNQNEKEAVARILEETQFNLSDAARKLQISRPSLYRLMHRHGLKRP